MWMLLAFNLFVPICTNLSFTSSELSYNHSKSGISTSNELEGLLVLPLILHKDHSFLPVLQVTKVQKVQVTSEHTLLIVHIMLPVQPSSHGGDPSSSLLEQCIPASWGGQVQEPGWCALFLNCWQGEAQLKIAMDFFIIASEITQGQHLSKEHKLSQFQEIQ